MVVKTYEPGEQKVIRGSVTRAVAILYRGPALVTSGEIPEKDWPFQTNNMTAWFSSSYKTLGAPMRNMLTKQRAISYVVNDGEGSKQGHGSNSNKLSYLLADAGVIDERLDICIESRPHAAIHHAKVAGGHIPKPRKVWTGLTYLDPRYRMVHQWDDASQEYLVYPMEEYYLEFPERRGNLPAKGIDDPDDVRSGKWYPSGAVRPHG